MSTELGDTSISGARVRAGDRSARDRGTGRPRTARVIAILRRPHIDLMVVFAVGLAMRVLIVARSAGGPLGDFGYDSSVYYAASDALLHGRMPYADFTLLHPPALMLALTPFALLGTFTSDHVGFVVANGAFEAIGAVNAVLVLLIARRAGVGRTAAITGALFYAVWPGAAGAEISARLEPLGNLFLLLAVLILVGTARDAPARNRMLLCGALLGAATATKIWWVVPLLVLAVWVLHRNRRQGYALLAGAATGSALIAGPFFLRSPADMWRMVVSDQLGRPAIGGSITQRLGEMTSMNGALPAAGAAQLALIPVGALVLTAIVFAWRRVALRPIVAMGVAQLLVLLAAPTYFGFYADYAAPALSLVLAAVVAVVAGTTVQRSGLRPRHLVGAACVAAVAASAAVELVVNAPSTVSAFPGAQLARATSHARVRCVMADSPMALIELDVLSRGLARGCPNRVDVSGSTYDVDKPTGAPVSRPRNVRWQHDLIRYLQSGNAEIVIRRATGIATDTRQRLDRLPLIASADGFALRRTP